MSTGRQEPAGRASARLARWHATLTGCVVALLLACAAPVAWASAQPLIEPDPVRLQAGAPAEAADQAAVRQAIVEAAGQRAWKVQDDKPGKLMLMAQTQTHIATVDVVYDGGGFQIKYNASQDMDYAVENGHPVIHPRYNRWISTLSNEIRRSVVFSHKVRHAGEGAAAPSPGPAQATSDAK